MPGDDIQLRPAGSKDQIACALTLRTDQETLDRLKRLAEERGADYYEIARRWL
jgi:hypothetical protein